MEEVEVKEDLEEKFKFLINKVQILQANLKIKLLN